jgi:hypothetical protein
MRPDYPLDLRDIDNYAIEGAIESLQNRFIITLDEPDLTADVYRRAQQRQDTDENIPNVFFPPRGEAILDDGIRQRLVDRFRDIHERHVRVVPQHGWFPWLFPAPERFPNALRDDPNRDGIRRAIALLDRASVCQRVVSFFKRPKQAFLCGICHEEDKTVHGGQIWLSCGHSFHFYCIGRNMTHRTTCPYCHVEIESMSRCRPFQALMGRKKKKIVSKKIKRERK